jgi:hypothetical protein
MNGLTTGDLLGIWESHMHLSRLERSLYLLGAVYDTDVNTIGGLSIGDRDARLLKFRERIFGNRLINIAECPQCSGQTEWEMLTGDIMLQEEQQDQSMKVLRLDKEGFEVDYRLPNSYDVLRAIADPALAREPGKFISDCIISIRRDKTEYAGGRLPQEILDDIGGCMAVADPQADIEMAVTCPDCRHQWRAPFDIITYLWTEIDNWAKRVLIDVSILARAFGWAEREILDLSPRRRQHYLELIAR